jgi:hypothetical protein
MSSVLGDPAKGCHCLLQIIDAGFCGAFNQRTFPFFKERGFDGMFGSRKNKEEHRYYLLPGMGRSNRRRHAQFVRWALVVGLTASALFGFFIWYMNQI